MTFKEVKKRVSFDITQEQSILLEKLQNKPFWIWNIELHKQEDIRTDGNCCFNHVIGLPQKGGIDKPLYDYEQIIFNTLLTQTTNKHLWIKKSPEIFQFGILLLFLVVLDVAAI